MSGMANNSTTKENILVVEDLHKSFGSLQVLKGVSLEAKNHDVISILGSSGSGKSTFLRCINLLETPNSGKVFVHGELIRMRDGARGHDVFGYAGRHARSAVGVPSLPLGVSVEIDGIFEIN